MQRSDFSTPETLGPARTEAHAAVQLLFRAAVANLVPRPGHEHTNLGWHVSEAQFETHALNAAGLKASLALDPLTLVVGSEMLHLEGTSVSEALAWLDAQLQDQGLQPASGVAITYDLPEAVTALTVFSDVPGLSALAAWFQLATQSLEALAQELSDITPGPSAVRCWPHHFDIATYVSLESGDPETARGVGVGLSPGDGSYDVPYFYVNAWPHLGVDTLGDPVAPGHWHTHGFVGLIATAPEILLLENIPKGTTVFLRQSFATSRAKLGL